MNIVITGASKGIGFEIGKSVAASGDHSIVVIARNLQHLKDLKNACLHENIKAKVIPIEFDLSDLDKIDNLLITKITAAIPNVDILINNAGKLINKPFIETSVADLQEQLMVNYMAPTLLIKALLPYFNIHAHVVNISSMGGVQGTVKFPGLSAYSSSKSAIATMTECLAEELKEKNIHFNTLALGAVNTAMLNKAFPGYEAEVQPSEMGKYIADFALNNGRLFNGKIIQVSSTTP